MSGKTRKLVHTLSLFMALGTLVGYVLTSAVHAQGSRPPSEVEVVNTPDVNVVNTPTVNIGNSPSVEISNTPSVEIGNTPTVNLSASASVRDRDNPALQPVQFSCTVLLNDGAQIAGATCVDGLLDLAGRTLVIENINAHVSSTDRPELRVSVVNRDFHNAITGIERRYYFQQCSPGSSCYWLDQQVRLYHTIQNIVVTFARTPPATGAVEWTAHFSGYLVD